MLNTAAPSIVPGVTKIFNLSLTTGRFPAAWKFARIVPIPKTGDLTNPSNYRPISILPILSKLLERHVHITFCLTICTLIVHSLLTSGVALKESQQPLHFFPLLMTVKMPLTLVRKFAPYSSTWVKHCLTPTVTLQTFLSPSPPFSVKMDNDYLSNRSQAVVLGGNTSNILPVVSGVPQGLVLGPLSFLIHIDQVASSVTNSNITMYAGNIAMYRSSLTPDSPNSRTATKQLSGLWGKRLADVNLSKHLIYVQPLTFDQQLSSVLPHLHIQQTKPQTLLHSCDVTCTDYYYPFMLYSTARSSSPQDA